ncbi:MAG TPA: protein-L-isoaspartate O-methyltransferase [Candidatus Saccharimonadales bacterium]|nr:protein-L-isoaspartate O-methyltransferase [Candidatus Saccharimonadales bacterium]
MNAGMDARVQQAFERIRREDFLPPSQRKNAGLNVALPIGYEQTNSQPLTVAIMLQLLDVQPGYKVLDVGSGSGWTSALIGWLVGEAGKVVAVDVIPELVRQSRQNLRKYDLPQVQVHQAQPGIIGWPPEVAYERILVSAAGKSLPDELVRQLAGGGRMVLPIQNDLWLITKNADGSIKRQKYPGFVFVPLVEN